MQQKYPCLTILIHFNASLSGKTEGKKQTFTEQGGGLEVPILHWPVSTQTLFSLMVKHCKFVAKAGHRWHQLVTSPNTSPWTWNKFANVFQFIWVKQWMHIWHINAHVALKYFQRKLLTCWGMDGGKTIIQFLTLLHWYPNFVPHWWLLWGSQAVPHPSTAKQGSCAMHCQTMRWVPGRVNGCHTNHAKRKLGSHSWTGFLNWETVPLGRQPFLQPCLANCRFREHDFGS